MRNEFRTKINKYKLSIYLMIALTMSVVVLVLWLPFGFTLIGLIEEWAILGLFKNEGLFFVINQHTPLSGHIARPLTILPFALPYYFDPNSFYYWHILLIFALFIKGAAAGQLVWKVTGSLKWALMMGVILLLYPADTMQLSFRAIHINCALALLLFASSVMIVALEESRRFYAYLMATIAAMILLVSICIYEASLLLVPLPFLLLYAKEGALQFMQQLRSKIGLVLAWIIAPSIYIIYFVSAAQKATSYQRQLIGEQAHAAIVNALPNLVKIGMLRSLVGGWFDAIRIVFIEFDGYVYLFIASLVILVCINLSKTRDINKADNLLALRLMVVGLISLILGYAPFLLSSSHVAINQRTFLYASIGAALFWIATLIWLSNKTKWLTSFLATAFVFFGLSAQLFQFHHYIQLGEQQRKTLKSIVENIDMSAKVKTIVISDESNLIGHTWMLFRPSLPGILSYFYDLPIKRVEVCKVPSNEWSYRDDLARSGKCIEQANAWILQAPGPVTGPSYLPKAKQQNVKLNKNAIVTIRINSEGLVESGNASKNYQDRLRAGNNIPALRYQKLLDTKTWPLQLIRFKAKVQPDYYKWSFGDWWSMELPERGSGWREAEWSVRNFYHYASAWKTQANSSLYFEFLPTKNDYVLQGEFIQFVSEKIHQSTEIRINQTILTLDWKTAKEFTATIPKGVLHAGLNRIDFNSDIDRSYYGLSSSLAWFEINAKNQKAQ